MNGFVEMLFDVKGLILNHMESDDKTITLYVEFQKKAHVCPQCGNHTDKVHDSRFQKVKEVSILGKETFLLFRKKRYLCKTCGKRFAEENPMLQRYARVTSRLKQYICDQLACECSFTHVAKETNLSVPTVISVFDKSVSYPVPSLGNAVSIDEFKGNTGQKYQCIVADPTEHKVLDILPVRYKGTVREYFKEQTAKVLKNVKHFVSDMWEPYHDVAKEVFPNAKRIVDKYHWIRQGIWAFESVRKQVQKNLKKKDRIRMKRSRYLLNKMHDYLSSSEKQSVDEMLTVSERLKAAYELKEAFFQILRAKNHRAALDAWVQKALSEGEHIFQECAATLLQWKEEILLSMRVSITNGFAEGCNNKIKVLKRNAYGYRNFARFRNRILHMFAKK